FSYTLCFDPLPRGTVPVFIRHTFPPPLRVVSLSHPLAPPEIYTLSLHDALPIFDPEAIHRAMTKKGETLKDGTILMVMCENQDEDRKSTRLNSSHVSISYAVFCLKKKKKKKK